MTTSSLASGPNAILVNRRTLARRPVRRVKLKRQCRLAPRTADDDRERISEGVVPGTPARRRRRVKKHFSRRRVRDRPRQCASNTGRASAADLERAGPRASLPARPWIGLRLTVPEPGINERESVSRSGGERRVRDRCPRGIECSRVYELRSWQAAKVFIPPSDRSSPAVRSLHRFVAGLGVRRRTEPESMRTGKRYEDRDRSKDPSRCGAVRVGAGALARRDGRWLRPCRARWRLRPAAVQRAAGYGASSG